MLISFSKQYYVVLVFFSVVDGLHVCRISQIKPNGGGCAPGVALFISTPWHIPALFMASDEKEKLTLLHLDFVCTVLMGNSYFFRWTMEALPHGFSKLLLKGTLGFWTCSCDCRGLCSHWILCLLRFELFLWIFSENITLVHTAIWIRSSSVVLLLIAFFIRCHWINYILRNSVELLFFMLLGFSCILPCYFLLLSGKAEALQCNLCFATGQLMVWALLWKSTRGIELCCCKPDEWNVRNYSCLDVGWLCF